MNTISTVMVFIGVWMVSFLWLIIYEPTIVKNGSVLWAASFFAFAPPLIIVGLMLWVTSLIRGDKSS